MRNSRKLLAALAGGAVLAAAGAAAAAPEVQFQRGTLTCGIEPGVSFVVGSKRDVECVYIGFDGSTEHFSGYLARYGVDVGVTARSALRWTVVAGEYAFDPQMLAGAYVGPALALTPGIGSDVSVLYGGDDRAISLEPIGGELNTGVNVALGIAELRLVRPVLPVT